MTSHTKADEFLEKFQKGGGSFPVQNFILQIFAIKKDTAIMNSRKNPQYDFPKMRAGGIKGCLELFQKFIRFGMGSHPL